LKEDGDWVQAGEKIALAGNTGGLANSALYFEIRHNGKPQDPKSWISARR
jgi:septal ring factor EnvC (AmiA/AmiB activator)